MPKAYSYIRFSSAKQAKGDSLRRQKELTDKFVAEHGLELDTELRFEDLGVSAYDRSNVEKGALKAFLDLVEEGKIPRGSYLLVENLDRLSRAKVTAALSVFIRILNAGITVVTLDDGHVYTQERIDEDLGSLIASIAYMSRANSESESKSRRLRKSWDEKRKGIATERLTARCPYWLRPVDGKVGFEPIPERVKVVMRIFQLSRDGIGNSTIVKMLNAEGVAPFSTKTDGWQTSYIQKILSNPAVHGELKLHLQRDGTMTPVDTIPDYYPAILSKEEWLLTNETRRGRRSRGGVSKGQHLSNLFSGLLKCGYCGGSMNMGGYTKKSANGQKREGKYVACSKARRGLGCEFIQWDYPHLEQLVLNYCKSVEFSKVLDQRSDVSAQIEDLEKLKIGWIDAVGDKSKSIARLTALIESGEGDADLSSVAKRIGVLQQEIGNLESQKQETERLLVKLRAEEASREHHQEAITEILDRLQTLDGTELHRLRVRLSELVRQPVVEIRIFPYWTFAGTAGKLPYDKLVKPDDLESTAVFYRQLKVPKTVLRYIEIHFGNGEKRQVSGATGGRGGVIDYSPGVEQGVVVEPFLWDIGGRRIVMAGEDDED